ncbi:TPA: DUF2635 domain-containing protein, partial [Shigella flexneri]|nr:DUF2635 domain-containing protein [Shigella flexneri]HCS3539427.1 DUF2635 domain-containing protein [Shigella flexneri]
VEESSYWFRRIAAGDVVRVKQDKAKKS